MKKTIERILACITVLGAIAGAVYYFKQKEQVEDDFEDDIFEDDFDLDNDLKSVSEREYVSLTPSCDSTEADENTETEETEADCECSKEESSENETENIES